MKKTVRIVYAYARTDDPSIGCFGKGDGLPWPHNKQDMKNFIASTRGATLLMGANTFRSLPSLLPGRSHVVMSGRSRGETIRTKDGCVPSRIVNGSFDQIIDELKLEMSTDLICVIGGASIIIQAIPFADEIHETEIYGRFEHDVTINLNELRKAKVNGEFNLHETHEYLLHGITQRVYKNEKIFKQTN